MSRSRCAAASSGALLAALGGALAGCAGVGGGAGGREAADVHTASIRIAVDPGTLRWRVEDTRAAPAAAPLFASEIVVDAEWAAASPGAAGTSPAEASLPRPAPGGPASWGPEVAAETALGPARRRTLTLAGAWPGAADRLGLDVTVTAPERRRGAAVAVAVRNTTARPVLLRRVVLANLDATRAALAERGNAAAAGAPAAPPVRLFLHPAVSWLEPRVVAAVPGMTHPSSDLTLAFDPASRETLLACFPSARAGYAGFAWRLPAARGPAGGALQLGAETNFVAHRLAPGERAAADELLLAWEADPQAALLVYAEAAAASSSGLWSPVPGLWSPVAGPESGAGPSNDRAPANRGADAAPAPAARPLVAWSSWYAAYRTVSEDLVLANLDFAARYLKDAGLSAIVLDDGYQKAAGDWEVNDRFPHGHRGLTDQIHARGLKAGLWIAPCLVAEKASLFREHPDWMTRDAEGRPRPDGEVADWGGRFFVLDAAHPDARRRLVEMARRAVTDWGYDFLKVDYLERETHGERAGAAVSPVRAYGLALDALREGCGADRLRLGSSLLAPSMGAAAAMRVAPDAGADWIGLRRAALALAARQVLHGRVWENDPDALILRATLTDDEARAWAALVAIMGGSVVSGDALTALPPERAALLQRTMPAAPAAAIPLDLFDAEHRRGPTLRPLVGSLQSPVQGPKSDAQPTGDRGQGTGDGGQGTDGLLVLPGAWRFMTGNDDARAQPAYDDSAWPFVAVPGPWEDSGFPDHDGYAWYRVRFTLPPGWPPGDAILDLGPVDDVDETYVNGQRVGATGRFPPNYQTQFSAPRRYTVPGALLRRPASSRVERPASRAVEAPSASPPPTAAAVAAPPPPEASAGSPKTSASARNLPAGAGGAAAGTAAAPAGESARPTADEATADNVIAVRVYDQGGPGGIFPSGPIWPPAVWRLPASLGGEPADLVLLINWTESPRRLSAPISRLGGPAGTPRVVFDATDETLLGEARDTIAADVRPHAARLLVLRAPVDRPQVVWTSRHVLPGVIDLEGVTWDAEKRLLRGASRRLIPPAGRLPGARDSAYAMAVYVPSQLSLGGVTASQPCAVVRPAPALVRVEFPEIVGDAVEWSLEFATR